MSEFLEDYVSYNYYPKYDLKNVQEVCEYSAECKQENYDLFDCNHCTENIEQNLEGFPVFDKKMSNDDDMFSLENKVTGLGTNFTSHGTFDYMSNFRKEEEDLESIDDFERLRLETKDNDEMEGYAQPSLHNYKNLSDAIENTFFKVDFNDENASVKCQNFKNETEEFTRFSEETNKTYFLITKEPKAKQDDNHCSVTTVSEVCSAKKQKKVAKKVVTGVKLIRYDEVLKNIKSKAFKPSLLRIKQLEKTNPKIKAIDYLIKYMRELFIVDANKETNYKKLNYSIIELFKTAGKDLITNVAKLKDKVLHSTTDLEKQKRLIKDFNEKNYDLKVITKELNIENLEQYFTERSNQILKTTYLKTIKDFSVSKECKFSRNKLLQDKKKEYIVHYDSILKDIESYLCKKKITFGFIGRLKKTQK